jgi:hypothetical protein
MLQYIQKALGSPEQSGAGAAPLSSAPKAIDCSSIERILEQANLDLKTEKYSRRMVGELKRLFSEGGLKDQREAGIQIEILERDGEPQDLSLLRVQLLRDGMNKDSTVYRHMVDRDLQSIVLEYRIPAEFPMAPPFVRVVFPRLEGGFVFTNGAICFEPLMKTSWAPAMSLLALTQAVKGIMDFNHVKVLWDKTLEKAKPYGPIPGYTFEGAQKEFSKLTSVHEGGKSWADLKKYKS